MGIDPECLLDLSSNTFRECADVTAGLLAGQPVPFLHYPDPEAVRLCSVLAAHEGVQPEAILPGNGAAELIWLCLRALLPRSVIMLGPMFSEYVRACRALGIPFELIPTRSECGFAPDAGVLQALRSSGADMAIICLPNNPGCSWYDPPRQLVRALGAKIVLADVSYREFLFGTPGHAATAAASLAEGLAPGARLVCIHSLTKFFCCPGIRLGYVQADPSFIRVLKAFQPPWMVASLAQQLGCRLIGHVGDYRRHLPSLRRDLAAMAAGLRRSGVFLPEELHVGPSFITARLVPGQESARTCRLLAGQGVIVRNCDTIPGMPPGFLRMQARPLRELEPLWRALEHVRAMLPAKGNTAVRPVS